MQLYAVIYDTKNIVQQNSTVLTPVILAVMSLSIEIKSLC